MSKVAIKVALGLVAIYLFTSCCFAYNREYVQRVEYYKVKSGDTVWEICEDYFDKQDRYRNFNEFVYVIRHINKLPGRPHIQIGDIIEIPLYVEVTR